MKRLPIGIQTFSEIINKNYLYIDKTKEISALIEDGKYFFLSRPRRFGKSLLLSTLKEIFSGNQELFKGLYIYNKIEWKKHPVVHIDFSDITYDKSIEVFEKSISNQLYTIAQHYNIELEAAPLKDLFSKLLKKLSTINQVVVLVDEYDKPIIDFMTRPEKAKANREVLRSLFTVLKKADPYLRLAFITGVSKFSKVSIFSGLNNLLDITLSAKFSTITGITGTELKEQFSGHLQSLADEENISIDELLKKIKHWYNGYSWDGINKLYNPTSLLHLFFENRFGNYWFATGTPTFLIKLMREHKYQITEIEYIQVGENIIDSYDIDYVDINSLLLQTGYLTIKEIEKIDDDYLYNLSSPNHEVKTSLLHYIMADYINNPISKIQPLHVQLKQTLAKKDLDRFLSILTSIFAGIPYNLHIEAEKYYHSLCYMVLALMGVKIDLEVLSDKGRVDGVLTLDRFIYVIEFKMGTAEEALKQIRERRYYEQFLNSGKEVLLLGVGGFSEKKVECRLEEV